MTIVSTPIVLAVPGVLAAAVTAGMRVILAPLAAAAVNRARSCPPARPW